MFRLPAGILRTLHVDREWITIGFGNPIVIIDGKSEIGCTSVKLLGPSELVANLNGKGAQNTVHLVTYSELEVIQ